MILNNKELGKDFTVIAECGSTHCGNLDLAKKQVDGAKEAGADAVKFIMANPDELIADKSLMYGTENLYDLIKSYRFSDSDWRKLARYCEEIGIDWYVTVGTRGYIPLAVELGAKALKVGGWCSRNYYLIEDILKTGLPIQFDICALIAGEVDNIVNFVGGHGAIPYDISFMYETHSQKLDEFNLASINFLQDTYNHTIPVGYSSNYLDINIDKLAIKQGAQFIEMRIKPDDEEGHQRSISLSPKKFKWWVYDIKEFNNNAGVATFNADVDINKIIGQYNLRPSFADFSKKNLYFTSMVIAKDIKKGEILTKEHLDARRPGNGISPYYDYLIVGKPAYRNFYENEILTYEILCEWQ